MAIDFTASYPLVQWDLNNRTLQKYYIGSVDDSANGYKLQILQDGDILTPSTEEVYFYFEKKDNTHGYIKATIIDGLYVVDLTNQVYAVAGNVSCNFQITSGGKWKTSPEFIIKVDDNNIQDSIESSNDFIAFQNALNSLVGVTENAITATDNAITATNNANTATTNATNATNTVIEHDTTYTANENERIGNEVLRLNYYYVTQAEYDALPDVDKDNPKYVYEITDDDGVLPTELQTLIDDTTAAKTAAENVVLQKNGINDAVINTIETWSSDKITKRIRTATFTASTISTNIIHNFSYNSTTDDLLVIYNGIILEKDINYIENSNGISIDLLGWSIASGEKIYFKLYKFVK